MRVASFPRPREAAKGAQERRLGGGADRSQSDMARSQVSGRNNSRRHGGLTVMRSRVPRHTPKPLTHAHLQSPTHTHGTPAVGVMIAAMVAIVVVVVVMVVAVLVLHHTATLMSSWNRSSTGGNDVGSGDTCSARDAASVKQGCTYGDPPTTAALLAQVSTAAATTALAALDPQSRYCRARCGGGDESCRPAGSHQRE